MNKSTKFRQLMASKDRVVLSGAHDALSAKLIEEAGFDGIWVSSFGISAATKCLPDANVLTMTEALEAAKGINEAVNIPVIADCDNGYGNALNVIRMVREYERAGIAGISIEDNPFPKKCSLYPGERKNLVDKDEMAGRIHAAKSTQTNKDFFVIARTEALIAGLGIDEALSRAYAYEEAGADAILIHSRQSTPVEIKEFASRWKGKVPLVAVPTKYPEITSKQLAKIGIRISIFANQALRASVVAMKTALAEIKKMDSVGSVNKKIAPLDEIFRLVGQPVMEENETKFVHNYKKPPTAIIVAAGFEKNLWPLNSDKPKAMLDLGGKSLIERQIEGLKRAGISRIATVLGYKQEKVKIPGIITYNNPQFRKTRILESLFCARKEMSDKFIFLYGDVLFEDFVLERLMKSKHDITIAVDLFSQNQRQLAEEKKERDLVLLRPPQNKVSKISYKMNPVNADGEFVGMAAFSKRGAKLFCEAYQRSMISTNGHPFHDATNFKKAQFTDLLQEMILRGEKVHCINAKGGWLEINSFADYQKAWQVFSVEGE